MKNWQPKVVKYKFTRDRQDPAHITAYWVYVWHGSLASHLYSWFILSLGCLSSLPPPPLHGSRLPLDSSTPQTSLFVWYMTLWYDIEHRGSPLVLQWSTEASNRMQMLKSHHEYPLLHHLSADSSPGFRSKGSQIDLWKREVLRVWTDHHEHTACNTPGETGI